MPRKPRVTEKHRQVARDLVKGATGKEALLRAGYGRAAAHKGIVVMKREVPALAQAIYEENLRAGAEFAANQKRLNKQQMEQVVEGTLIRNSLKGEGKQEGSTYAAKTLGQLSRVNMFEPERFIGIAAMPVPPEWVERYTLPPEKANAKALALPPAPEEEESKPDTG